MMKPKYLNDIKHSKILKHWKTKQQWRTVGGKQCVNIKTHTRGGKAKQNPAECLVLIFFFNSKKK